MNFALPRPRGPVQRALALLSSAALAPPALVIPALAQAPAPTSTPPALGAGGPSVLRPLSGAHNLIARRAPAPMGTNNAVRLWVRGDGSGATLRVHLIAAGADAAAGDAALTSPAWLSAPIPVTWTGWHELLLPREKFTLRDAGLPTALNAALPADAQPDGGAVVAPDWADINVVGLETGVAKRAALGLDDVAWVTLGPDGTGTASTPVDDFETGDFAAWQSVGTAGQKSALVPSLATAPAQVHGGRVAFNLTVTAPVSARQAALTSAKQVMAATGKPYLVWTPAQRFEPVLPTSLPPAAGGNPDLLLQAAPDQTLGASFCLYSAKSLSNVTVTAPEQLEGIGHVLKPGPHDPPVLDVRMVKVMTEPGGGLIREDDLSSPTPDLLVKDDRAPLSGTAPAVTLTGNAVTDIPANTAKQFWVTVAVPRNAISGLYSARFLVRGTGLASPVPVRLSLTVLPLRLMSPSKEYAINLRSRLDPAPAALPSADGHEFVTDFVSKSVLDAQLADIVAHGFHIATLYDSPATLWDALAEYQAAGLTSPFVYKGDGDPREIEAQRQAHNAPDFLYFVDPTSDAAARAASLGKRGLPVTTYITRLSDFNALGASLRVPVYSLDSDYSQQLLQTHGRRLSGNVDWWYWPAADEDPTANRLACGWSLFRANLYGAFIPDYQTAFGADPYDLSSAGAAPDRAALRSQMLTYPTQDGVLDTLRWEAAREGVVDVRYLTTLYDNLRQCKDAHIAKPLTDQAEAFVKTFVDKSPAVLTDADLDKARAQVAHYALLLRAQLDGYNKAHHITQ